MTLFFPRTNAEKKRAAALMERRRNRLERKFGPQFYKELRKATKDLADLYEKSGSLGAGMELRIAEHEQRVVTLLQELYRGTIGNIVRSVQRDLPKERKNLEGTIQAQILEWVSSRALSKARFIAETTKKNIIKIIREGQEEGEALGERVIARRIIERTRSINRFRATMIARTETHTASQNASLEVAKSIGGEMRKEWVAVEDDRTRDAHSSIDGQTAGMDEPFNVNGSMMRYPGDPSGPADQVINCRCVLVYVESTDA